MGLQLLKYTASSAKSLVRDQPWWTGWMCAGQSPWHIKLIEKSRACSIQRVEQDGWVDFFLGKATHSGHEVHSILEGKAKVGLHFCSEDAYDLFKSPCPSSEIPAHLWQLLQQEILTCN